MFQEVVPTGKVWQAGGGCTLNPAPHRTDNMHAHAILTPLTRAQMALRHSQSGCSLRDTAAALTLHLEARLWTGDEELEPGLRAKRFDQFFEP